MFPSNSETWTRDTDTRHQPQPCHCSGPQQIQPWEFCCEKYLIDIQPIEHNCVSYKLQECSAAIMQYKVWALAVGKLLSGFKSVYLTRPGRFLCLPPNPQATSCLLILIHIKPLLLSLVCTSSLCHQTGGHGANHGDSSESYPVRAYYESCLLRSFLVVAFNLSD